MHIAHSIGTMDSGVYDGLKPCVVRIFGGGIEMPVRAQLGELANLRLKNLNGTLNNGWEISLCPVIFDRVVVCTRFLLLPLESSNRTRHPGNFPDGSLAKSKTHATLGTKIPASIFPRCLSTNMSSSLFS